MRGYGFGEDCNQEPRTVNQGLHFREFVDCFANQEGNPKILIVLRNGVMYSNRPSALLEKTPLTRTQLFQIIFVREMLYLSDRKRVVWFQILVHTISHQSIQRINLVLWICGFSVTGFPDQIFERLPFPVVPTKADYFEPYYSNPLLEHRNF